MKPSVNHLSKQILDITPKMMGFIRTEMRRHATDQITVPQFRVLLKMSREPAISNKAIAEWLGVSAPTLSRMIATLTRRGLVKRKIDSKDKRLAHLSITASGQKQIERYRQEVQARLNDRVTLLNAVDQKNLLQGLEILQNLFQK